MKAIFLIFFLSSGIMANTQNSDYIFCKIIDQQTKEPVVFATVQIKSENIGVIADEFGVFRLPLSARTEKKTIILSSMGYKTNEFQVGDFFLEKLNVLRLAPQFESLEAVTIVSKRNKKDEPYISPEEIVQKAIFNMRLNLPTEPHSYIAYYRDYQLLNNKYFNLNEGIIEEFDAGVQTNKLKYKHNKSALYSFQQNPDFSKDSILNLPYNQNNTKFIKNASVSNFGGNELSILHIHNAVRNYEKQSFSFIDVFKDDFLYNHKFRYLSKLYQDERSISKLALYALENVTGIYHSANGFIYIDNDTFAIQKLEYFVYDKEDDIPLYSLIVEYKPLNGKMYLNYISFYNKFKAQSKNAFKIDSVKFDETKEQLIVNFSKNINENTLNKNRQIKLSINQEKIKIEEFEIIDPKTISLNAENLRLYLSQNVQNTIKVDIRKIEDISGRQLNEVNLLDAKQYRELFVQQVNINKAFNNDLKFINTNDVLKNAPINENVEISNDFWVNSPLIKASN